MKLHELTHDDPHTGDFHYLRTISADSYSFLKSEIPIEIRQHITQQENNATIQVLSHPSHFPELAAYLQAKTNQLRNSAVRMYIQNCSTFELKNSLTNRDLKNIKIVPTSTHHTGPILKKSPKSAV